MDFSLIKILKKPGRIQIVDKIETWQEAIYLGFEPLIQNNSISQNYLKKVIETTKQQGPYYILVNKVAMPHSQNQKNVFRSDIALLIVKNGFYFEKDLRKIFILICIASVDPEAHMTKFLPQIATIFEEEKNINKIAAAKHVEEIIALLETVDLQKYF